MNAAGVPSLAVLVAALGRPDLPLSVQLAWIRENDALPAVRTR